MSMLQEHQKSAKVCFVTIGATTSFDSLIKAALSPPFLQALQTHGYTELCLQHGKEGRAIVDTFMKRADAAGTERHGINISGFDFNKKGLGREMRAAKGGGGGGAEGIVISHAGNATHVCPYKGAKSDLTNRLRIHP